VAFAGGAFLQAPLTIDYSAVVGSINELDTNIIPQGGTQIAGAIRTAAEAFGKGESESRCLILITDGEDLGSSAVEAARRHSGEFRIFTVGVGSTDGAIIPVPEEGGGTKFVKDPQGQFVKSRLDEACLREIAQASGGLYLHLENGPAAVKRIVGEGLGQMKERDIDARTARRPIERYQWPLAFGLLLLAIAVLINERKGGGRMTSLRRLAVLLAISTLLNPSTSRAELNFGPEAIKKLTRNH
jgi:Ca-activated chloride channel family protein